MKRLIIFFSLLGCLALVACETDHTYEQFIQNDAPEAVTFEFYGNDSLDFGSSLEIAPNAKVNVRTFTKFGAQPDGLSCLPTLDSVQVISASGKNLTKDFLHEDNWVSEVEGKRSVFQQCTFSFSNVDLN